MIIVPSLVIIIACIIVVSSLILSSAVKIDKELKSARKFAIISSCVGFGGLGIFLFLLIFNKYKGGIKDIYLYLLVWLWLILIVLAAITYITYEKLLDSESHKLEKNLAFSSFCLSIVGIAVGITYILTTMANKGDFDSLDKVFGYKTKPPEDIELENILNDLEDKSF